MVYWLRQTSHNQEVVGPNPSIVYWMDVSDARYYINPVAPNFVKAAEHLRLEKGPVEHSRLTKKLVKQ
jgi:hypothetical protein